MISIKNLKKSFGEIEVLKDINLDIKKGSIFGLAGRSGEGKSTLLRCMNGLESYDSGEIIINGVQINKLNEKELLEFRKNIGMIFQQFSLLERLNVYDNIALPLKCWNFDKKYIDKRVKELLKLVELEDKIYSKPKELSGGQKQRVAIARALSMKPDILLCDEATSALDPKTAKSIIKLLDKINRQIDITIVFVSHQMDIIQSICGEIAILENGKVGDIGLVENIFTNKPKSLINLIGDEDIDMPKIGVNIELFLKDEEDMKKLTLKLKGENFFIVSGNRQEFRYNTLNSLIINIDRDDFESVKSRIQSFKWYIIN